MSSTILFDQRKFRRMFSNVEPTHRRQAFRICKSADQ
jgi:hypothetical protein